MAMILHAAICLSMAGLEGELCTLDLVALVSLANLVSHTRIYILLIDLACSILHEKPLGFA